ncbi:TetR/AcrR family transcriptional regulator [Cellulomonas soli]|uniref:TetR family transcriptional regulator n=1 Tax=Cellulomonas soli TaxID=931535 RepID=A0A512P8M0_9CELL|nr:TetR/AcrR family transcriptional regulator [Cellulomonas soli]NYI57772.1 AcrR family transcriptional regulator [Cellulomonas soli]GEP67556.1 TetR family transcriptional regulator [Cellulomonas soli]
MGDRDGARDDAGAPRHRGPRMARDERRAQVLQIAQELFSSEGFHHVSMDDIAVRAEVSKPVLYRHFPSKLDLYLAVVDQRGAELVAAVDAAVAPLSRGPMNPGDGRAIVVAVVRAYFTFVDAAGQSSALLFESDVTHDADVRTRVESASSQVAETIAVALGSSTGLSREPALLLATSLIAMAQGAATHRFRGGSTLGMEESVDLVARLCWGGVAGLARDHAAEATA